MNKYAWTCFGQKRESTQKQNRIKNITIIARGGNRTVPTRNPSDADATEHIDWSQAI